MKEPAISQERWLEIKAEAKFDTAEFLAAEAERKADLLSDIRCGENYARESRKLHAREGRSATGTITIASSYNPWSPDWSEQHEA